MAGDAQKPEQTKKNPVGRPPVYTDELADIICDRLAAGESLREICKDDGIPSRSTVLLWVKKDENFRAKCARAREAQAESVIEDMIDIEADLKKGEITSDVARVLLSSKQWRACKQAPKKYGEKLQLSSSPENPLTVMLAAVQGTAITPDKN